MHLKKIFAISGSTRTKSSNLNLIKAISNSFSDQFSFTIYENLVKLPHFNPDEEPTASVHDFITQIFEADGVLICTPEYAHGVPGSLKNAIDWTVGSGAFSQKPTLLITASTDGHFGHQALLETLRVIEAKDIDSLNLLIQFIRTKVNADGEITDKETAAEIAGLMERFGQAIIS
ncbi:MAG: NADPH-dependent FMN reductase [Pedobacter sp.]|nr:NADPH-dependent FMN reductase [Pedobacter sp.]MDQ8053399.1 NADPH-dependent FMN reductase [Pedobacter sp.]